MTASGSRRPEQSSTRQARFHQGDLRITMKRLDLGQTINTLANIGVIAGIVFLAVEVDQFQDQMEAQTNFNYYSVLSNSLAQVSTSPFLSEVFAKLYSGDELTPAEEVAADNFIESIFQTWGYAWREYEAGRFDASRTTIRTIATDFNELKDGPFGSRFREHWDRGKTLREPGLVEFLEEGVLND
jgi:hypothetical protein